VSPFVSYTIRRLGLFVVAASLLWLLGVRGFPLLLGAILLSGVASFVLLSRHRDAMGRSLMTVRGRAGDFYDTGGPSAMESPASAPHTEGAVSAHHTDDAT
jgi:hypothetical protein